MLVTRQWSPFQCLTQVVPSRGLKQGPHKWVPSIVSNSVSNPEGSQQAVPSTRSPKLCPLRGSLQEFFSRGSPPGSQFRGPSCRFHPR